MADICLNHAEHVKKFDAQNLLNQDYERRISSLETKVEVNKTSTDLKLEHMDIKLDTILETVKVNQSRLPNLIWGIGGSVGGGVLVWLILEFLKR